MKLSELRILLFSHGEILVALCCAFVAFGGYCGTMAPGLTFIDAGELATVACRLGVAHPTGYPLFTLVGHLFSLLPLGSEPIQSLNLMAAAFCAAGIGVFARLTMFFLLGIFPQDQRRILAASAGAALLLAFSLTYWSQGTSIEVYPLHCLFLPTVTLAFLQAFETNSTSSWCMFAFLLGLSFTNHMTMVLLAPGFLYYYFATQGWGARSWRTIGLMVLPFLLGLSLYLYLPIRAGQHPWLNWGNPVTLDRFLWHISGGQYRVWMLSSKEVMGKQFEHFLGGFPAEFSPIGMLLAAIGLFSLWKAEKRKAVFTLLLFVGCVAYAINYDINDIDSYFLLAFSVTALWAGIGLYVAGGWIMRTRVVAALARDIFLVIPAILVFSLHLTDVNERDNHIVEDYTKNMFSSFAPNALVLSFQWDHWVAGAYYTQHIRGERTDVTVIDKELLRRSWYLTQLQKNYPQLIERSRDEVRVFLHEVDRFEQGLPYNGSVIEASYAGMILAFIRNSIQDCPVYVTAEMQPEYTAGYQRVPEGLAMRLYPDTVFHSTAAPRFFYRRLERTGRLEDQNRKLYADALTARGDYYLARRGDREEALRDYNEALRFTPGNPGILERFDALAHRH